MSTINKIELGGNVYDLSVKAENIDGKVPVDLDNYYNKQETNALLNDKVSSRLATDLSNIETAGEQKIKEIAGGGSKAEGSPTFTLNVLGDSSYLLNYVHAEAKLIDDTTGEVIETTFNNFIKDIYKYSITSKKFSNIRIKTYDEEFYGVGTIVDAIYSSVGYRLFGYNHKFLVEIELDSETHMPVPYDVRISSVESNDEKYQEKLTAGDNIEIIDNVISAKSSGGEQQVYTWFSASNIAYATVTSNGYTSSIYPQETAVTLKDFIINIYTKAKKSNNPVMFILYFNDDQVLTGSIPARDTSSTGYVIANGWDYKFRIEVGLSVVDNVRVPNGFVMMTVTKLSDSYASNSTNKLTNYYTKTDIDNKIGNIENLLSEV